MDSLFPLTGTAKDERETFEFSIEPFVTGGFRLDIRYHGDCHQNVTGAGIWPTVEKAQEIAHEIANRLLHGAQVIWSEHQDNDR
jgi:hypothetical protein